MSLDENKWARFAAENVPAKIEQGQLERDAEQAKPMPTPPFQEMLELPGFDDPSIIDR